MSVLALMCDHKDDPEGEIVCDGLACWLGDRQISRSTVAVLLHHLAIKDVSDVKGIDRYAINETGEAIVRRPQLAYEILEAVKVGRAFTTVDDRVQFLEPTPAHSDETGRGA